MLVKKFNYNSGDVINLKLISGDEVVGQLVGNHDQGYELSKPCIVVTSPDGIGLLQAMFGLDADKENLYYRDQHVITMCLTHEKMRDHYLTVVNAD